MKAQGERMYSSYSFSISVLDWGEWSASRPGRALPPEIGFSAPIGQEAGWGSMKIFIYNFSSFYNLVDIGSKTDSTSCQIIICVKEDGREL
jgi:hypothetical protein